MSDIIFPFKVPFAIVTYNNNDEIKKLSNKYFYSDDFRKKLNLLGDQKKDYSIGPNIQDHKRNLYESPGVLFDIDLENYSDNEIWKNFKNFISKSVENFSNHVNQSFINYNQKSKIVDSWFHITNNSGYHSVHDHRNYAWGCIYYVQTEGCKVPNFGINYSNGINNFYSPFEKLTRNVKGLEWCSNTGIFTPNPIEGNLVIFPGFLSHDAISYNGEQDRIVIAANIDIIENY